MADLKAIVEGLGYANARTLLNSGNVVFDTGRAKGDPGARIEKALLAKTGIASRTTSLTAAEVAAIVDGNTLLRSAEKSPSQFLVAVLYDASDVKQLAPSVLRHRLVLQPEAEFEGISADRVVEVILGESPVPKSAA